MSIINCPKCGRLFSNEIGAICKSCFDEEEKIFEEVRLYIKEHPDSRMGEVSDATGVSAKKIIRYIKEGRLEISKGMVGEVKCDSCGKPITTGKFCSDCIKKISNDVKDTIRKEPVEKPKEKASAKMHITKKL